MDVSALFDAQRPVRSLLPSSHTVTIPIRLLNAELTCAVCLGILRQCTAVTFCLHRFCAVCIGKSLRFGKKECPQCRHACPSHRNLRADPVFDAIIAAIYPDLERAEAAQDRAIEAMIDAANVGQFAESALKGARIQAERARERAAQQKKLQEQQRAQAEERRKRMENTAWICLLPLPPRSPDDVLDPRLQLSKPHVKTTKAVTMQLLALYVRTKLEAGAQQTPAQAVEEKAPAEPADAEMAVTPASSSSAFPTSTLPVAAPVSAVGRLRVSVWMRWVDMTDVARRVWLQGRTLKQQPQPAPAALPALPFVPLPSLNSPIVPSAAAAAAAVALANARPSTNGVATPRSSASPAANPASDAAAPTAFAASPSMPLPPIKRPRGRVEQPSYPVWCAGFTGREEQPDFVELAGPTTARFLYDRHWDERRATSAAAASGATWKKLTLFYLVEQLDGSDDRAVKKRATTLVLTENNDDALLVPAPTSTRSPTPPSPTSAASSSTAPEGSWSPSAALSSSADLRVLSALPLSASSTAVFV